MSEMFDMKSCLEQAALPKRVHDITLIVHMDNYNALRSHFREKSGAVGLLCRTNNTACIFEYFELSSDYLVFHGGSLVQMKHNFCERHPRAARQTLSNHLQDGEFWNCKICGREAKEDALEACHCLQCGNLLCYTCLKHMLSVKVPWRDGCRVPIACPMCRDPQAFICHTNEVGSEKRKQVDVYGLSRGA